jgi:hypothetical protein
LPFVLAHSSPSTPLRAFEAYYADLEATYTGAGGPGGRQGYSDVCWPPGTVTANPYAPYNAVFETVVVKP